MKSTTSAPLPATDPRLGRVRALGRLLDNSIPIPGTGRRIGIDPLLGLIPGLGDGAGALLSAYIILEAARFGVPRATLVRMAANVGLEALVGTVPVLGDLFDAGWKANLRNVGLLHAHAADAPAAARSDRHFALGLVAAVLLLVIGSAAVAVWIGTQLIQAIAGLF